MELSVTQVMALYIFAGASLYFVISLPSITPILNVILAIVYGLFVFNIINFKSQQSNITLILLVIIMGLSLFQIITTSRKYAVLGGAFQFIGSATGFLIYSGMIKNIKFLKQLL